MAIGWKFKLHFVGYITDMCSTVGSICRVQLTCSGTYISKVAVIFFHEQMPIM